MAVQQCVVDCASQVMQADTQALRETVVESLAWFLTPALPGGARRRWWSSHSP